jgi:serine/threonine protein kinase/uncharacterized protein YfbU (UPF0304 family)
MNAEQFPNIEGYRISRKIGEGGMAQVYLAVQESFERNVALKVLSPHLTKDESFEKRFIREARNAAQLSHQSIVPIYDFGQSNGFHFMAMEYLPGGDLKQRMAEGIPLGEAISIVKAIAKGLDYAGKKGLVHRDIKPENILFREDRSPVISDFGIARQVNSHTNVTMVGSVVGTPRYMSPEQAQGYEVDHRSDLYSLSVILYELLCGNAPFISDSAISVSIKHITEMPPPLPPQLAIFQGIIDKALEKNPDDRFQTGADLAMALTMAEDRISSTYAKTVVLNTSEILTATAASQRGTGSRFVTPSLQQPIPKANYSGTQYSATQHGATQYGTMAEPQRPFYKKPLAVAAAFVVIQALAFGGWYLVSSSGNKPAVTFSGSSDGNIIPGMAEKAEELLNQARAAGKQNKLFEPQGDNVQHYLTTLLALIPHHATGRDEIRQLFERYLNTAEQALRSGDIGQAEQFLNQSSQISYYIESGALKERFSSLYQALLQQRQRSLVAGEKTRKIESLLQNANTALQEDRLTSPPGDNAFEYFQQVLVESPQNQQAIAGIQQTATRLLQNARAQSEQGQFAVAHAFIAAAAQIAPGHPEITQTQDHVLQAQQTAQDALLREKNQRDDQFLAEKQRLEKEREAQRQQINQWLTTAQKLVQEGQLMTPAQPNALALYDQVLAGDPANIAAIQGREQIGALLVEQATTQARSGRFDEARKTLDFASDLLTSKTGVVATERLIAELEQQNRLQSLLGQARTAIAENRLEYPDNDNAILHYNRILELDPSNLEARQGIESVGLKYIELSRDALSRSNFSQARKLLDKAKRYTSSEIEIQMAENFLKESASSHRVGQLLDSARTALQRNRLTKPDNDNALFYYQQVLALAPQNADAVAGLEDIRTRYAGMIEKALETGKPERARELLPVLKEIGADAQYAQLEARLNEADSRVAEQSADERAAADKVRQQQITRNRQLIDTYLGEIANLRQKPKSATNNGALIDRYLAILDMVPGHEEAEAGLADTIGYEEQLALAALDKFDLTTADRHINIIRTAAPGFDLGPINSQKTIVRRKLAEVEDNVNKIEANLAQPYVKPGWLESNRFQRDLLISTYNYIDDIRLVNPQDSRVKGYLERLDQKYADVVAQLIDDDAEEAAKFIADTRNFDWSGTRLGKLRKRLPPEAEAQIAEPEEADVDALLAEADLLIAQRYIKPGLLETNRDARDRLIKAYNNIDDVRRVQPKEERIGIWLDKLDRKYADIVNLLIRENSADEAEKFIRDTRNYSWKGTQLTIAASKLTASAARGGLSDVDQEAAITLLLDEAQMLIALPYIKPGLLESNRLPRERLRKAYTNLNDVRRLDPKNPQLDILFAMLDQKYADIVRQLKQDDDDDAFEFINDTKSYNWKSPKLSAVMLQAR